MLGVQNPSEVVSYEDFEIPIGYSGESSTTHELYLCVAYTKCVATSWHGRISLFVAPVTWSSKPHMYALRTYVLKDLNCRAAFQSTSPLFCLRLITVGPCGSARLLNLAIDCKSLKSHWERGHSIAFGYKLESC